MDRREKLHVGDRVVYRDWWHGTEHRGMIREVDDSPPSKGCLIEFDPGQEHPRGARLWLIGATTYRESILRHV